MKYFTSTALTDYFSQTTGDENNKAGKYPYIIIKSLTQ